MPITDDSFTTVMNDVVAGLADSFTPRHADDDDEEPFRMNKYFKDVPAISNEQVVAVPWTFLCKHTGDFHCLFPTGRDVTIEGITLVDTRNGDTTLHRYVDWLGLTVQLGLEVSWRVAVTEDEYEFGRDRS